MLSTAKHEPSTAMVYVAGPYTSPYPIYNMRRAMEVGMQIAKEAHVATIIPHLTGLVDMVFPEPYEVWCELDMRQLEHCDVVYRFKGKSSGGKAEVLHAVEFGIPVVYEDPEDAITELGEEFAANAQYGLPELFRVLDGLGKGKSEAAA